MTEDLPSVPPTTDGSRAAHQPSTTEHALVARDLDGQVAVLTMQSAPHNLLGERLIRELLAAVNWVRDVSARAVVLRSGLRHFSAGAEIEAFATAERGEATELPLLDLLQAFDSLPVPIVASVNGVCVGGGLELALASDLVVAAASAKLGSVEVTIGLAPLMGAVQRITQRAGAARAKEMAMLGRRFDARTLERWNVINRVVPDDDLVAATMTLAQELANGPAVALASIKELVSIAESGGVAVADQKMKAVQAGIWRSQDLKTGIASLTENGPGYARFQGR
jgi:enoyl-CoA hydratase/carnithine racemase